MFKQALLLFCALIISNYCFAQDALEVAYVQTSEERWQLIDKSDKVIADSLFEHDSLAVLHCNEGMAVTEWGGKYGFRDLFDGTFIGPQFDTVTTFKANHAAVRTKAGWHLIDRKGNMDAKVLTAAQLQEYLQPIAISECEKGYCLIENDSTVNCKGPGGQLILPPGDVFVAPWNDVNSFISDRILKFKVMADRVCSCQKLTSYYGFVDRKGSWVIEPTFEQGDIFSCGLASVSEGAENIYTFGYINEAGAWMIEPVYKEAGRFMRVTRN